MGCKKITVVTDYGSVEAHWYPSDGTIYAGGSRIGSAREIGDAQAVVERYAERKTGGKVKEVHISDVSSGLCFLTGACVEALGLPDCCWELQAFRRLRDEYVRVLPEGPQLIQEYYETSPAIVEAIRERTDSARIWREIYETLVLPGANLVSSGRMEEAANLFIKHLAALKKVYLDEPTSLS